MMQDLYLVATGQTYSVCAIARKPQLVIIPTAPRFASLWPASTNLSMKESSYGPEHTTCASDEPATFSRINGNGHVFSLKGSPGGLCKMTSIEINPSGGISSLNFVSPEIFSTASSTSPCASVVWS